MDQAPAEIIARHYCIAAAWADSPEGTCPRITAQAMRKARVIAFDFLKTCTDRGILRPLIDAGKSDGYGSHPDCGRDKPWFAAAGHDLYLTSARHGAGFQDRTELSEGLRDALESVARGMPEPQPDFYRGWMYFN